NAGASFFQRDHPAVVLVFEWLQWFAPAADKLVRIQERHASIVGDVQWRPSGRFLGTKPLIKRLSRLLLQLAAHIGLDSCRRPMFQGANPFEKRGMVLQCCRDLFFLAIAHLMWVRKLRKEL